MPRNSIPVIAFIIYAAQFTTRKIALSVAPLYLILLRATDGDTINGFLVCYRHYGILKAKYKQLKTFPNRQFCTQRRTI